MDTFDSTKNKLFGILEDAGSGKIQLPDFQRGWVWDDERIKGIIASVGKSFPIGAVMLLETGNKDVKFKTKPIEGSPISSDKAAELLILDGQQRITSLYQAIASKNIVNTRNDKGYEIKRWYYIDMTKALEPNTDLEEAVFSVNENKLITSNIGRDIELDLSKSEYEFNKLMYPVSMIQNYAEWRRGYNEYWNHDSEKSRFWDSFEEKVINHFTGYELPVITMKKINSKEAVCQVFEKVNTGGVSLTVFELLTATYAADDFDLKEDWKITQKMMSKNPVLEDVHNTDFIQSITLLSTYNKRKQALANKVPADEIPGVSCKRKDMLALGLAEYQKYKDLALKGFVKAGKLLSENHIYKGSDLPYATQLIPLSAILSVIGDEIDNVGHKRKLLRWYWCGVLGELYGSANETRYALDLPQVVEYIIGKGEEPGTIYDANFSPTRLHTLKTRNSAAYKGIYALLITENTRDWMTNTKIDFNTYFSESIDIHHIFPKRWCKENKIKRKDYDCIINKTPLNGRTNRIVGGKAPSYYLPKVKEQIGIADAEFKDMLESHFLDSSKLFKDDFYGFFEDRKERLLSLIESAMGKKINREGAVHEEGQLIDNNDEEDDSDTEKDA